MVLALHSQTDSCGWYCCCLHWCAIKTANLHSNKNATKEDETSCLLHVQQDDKVLHEASFTCERVWGYCYCKRGSWLQFLQVSWEASTQNIHLCFTRECEKPEVCFTWESRDLFYSTLIFWFLNLRQNPIWATFGSSQLFYRHLSTNELSRALPWLVVRPSVTRSLPDSVLSRTDIKV